MLLKSVNDYLFAGPLFTRKRRFLIGIGIPIIYLRRYDDRLMFIMGIPIPIRRRLLGVIFLKNNRQAV